MQEQQTQSFTEHPITLTHHILETQRHHPGASGDLSTLLHAFEIASKYVSSQVRAAGIFKIYGAEGSVNVQGEEVKKLDVLANDSFITSLRRSKKVCIMVSEENTDPILVEDPSGKYVAVFDPLDGSSNIDANIAIGTIFGIYHRTSSHEQKPTIQDVLQPGNKLVAAGYAMYGSATVLVLTVEGEGVDGFTLDPSTGEFVLTHPNIKIPPKNKGQIYSVNEGNSKYWDESTLKYVHSIKFPEKGSPYKSRYIGSMVADVHRTLLYGGIFMYPADKNSKDGKLRLLYEANPMAMLTEAAGGKASTGTERILDIVPKSAHQRTPVFLGNSDDVADVETCYREGNQINTKL